MTKKNKERLYDSLTTAAELIKSQVHVGINPEEVNEVDEKGLIAYERMCKKASIMIEKLAEKYKDTTN